jgi:cell division septation protein DedD
MIGSPHRPRLVVAVSVMAVALAACASGSSPNGSSGARASGATCQTAPAAPASIAGWQPPATPPPIYPTIIAQPGELTCGRNRLLFSFLDASNNVLAKPDRTAKVTLYDLGRDATKPVSTADATFVWAIQDVRGVYVANVDIPEAGTYGFEFTTSVAGGPPQTIRATSDIEATTTLVQVGQHAPSTKTPTATDAGGDLTHISTDPTPDPSFYQTSEDQAVAAHKAFVLIFATPKFCQTAQCGPTLDRIKPFVTKYPTVTFIHGEPYALKLDTGELQAVLTNNALTPTATTNAWGLSSEPWVFIVDSQGIVRGSFGLIFSDAELTAALDGLK